MVMMIAMDVAVIMGMTLDKAVVLVIVVLTMAS